MPRPIQPSAFSYLLPTLVQSGDNTQSSGASGWTPGGALSLQIPDNTVIGGNPRGLGAVDLQTQRTAATQVASGANSFVMGVNNIASGLQSVAMGSGNTASGQSATAKGQSNTASAQSAVAMGQGNSASGLYSIAIGTSSNAGSSSQTTALGTSTASSTSASAIGFGTASGSYAFAAGLSNASGGSATAMGRSTASGENSTAVGYSNAVQTGKFTHSGSRFSATGDAQTGMLVVRASTTDATPTVATSDGGGAASFNQLILSNNSAFTFSILVVGRQQAAGGTASAAFEIKGLIRREANAASTTLVNSATTVISNASGWAVAVSADTTNGGLAITVTGAAATNIRWVATAYTSEVTYA